MTCPECNSTNPVSSERCDCGHEFNPVTKPETAVYAICVYCGKGYTSPADFDSHARPAAVCLKCFSRPLIELVAEKDEVNLPFSFGACGITALWLLCHGEVPVGVGLIVLNWVLIVIAKVFAAGPLLSLAVGVGISIYYGMNGSRIAVIDRQYKSLADLRSGERGWTIAGIIALIVLVVAPISATI
jgi:hypothetical protein